MKLFTLDEHQPEAITGEVLLRVMRLCASPRRVKFYQSGEWMNIRRRVLDKHNNECEMCRRAGKYSRATMVHHVWFLDKHPELALAEHYYSDGNKHMQLMPLCHKCHEEIHQHRHKKTKAAVTPERW